MSRKLQVRLISPWTKEVDTEEAFFSVDIPAEEADALLSEWSPSPELFTFPRRKAWYCCEPQCQFRHLSSGTWPKIKASLKSSEFLFHGHTDERYKVPHITHFQPLEMNRNLDRKNKAIAIVSNHGGAPLRRHPDITYRNRLITQPLVDLFGRRGWNRYQRSWYSWPGAPKNYKGEIPGDWPGEEKRRLMSEYKVAICLENMLEPGYFTEKFVEAVVAGCIPVYRASEEVATTFLQGAAWVDPNNEKHAGPLTVEEALSRDLATIQLQNLAWLQSNPWFTKTHADTVFRRIGQILRCD